MIVGSPNASRCSMFRVRNPVLRSDGCQRVSSLSDSLGLDESPTALSAFGFATTTDGPSDSIESDEQAQPG